MPPILLAKRQKYEKSRVENTRDFKRFLLNRDNRNLFAVASHTLKLDGPVRKREQCVVRAAPDIDARQRASRPGVWIRNRVRFWWSLRPSYVPSIKHLCFLSRSLLSLDRLNLNLGIGLPVTHLAGRTLLRTIGENGNLL